MRWFLPLILVLFSCGNAQAPLDAQARHTVDSLVNSQVAHSRALLDSLCKQEHDDRLKVLMDSIKKVRKEVIERQIKSIPK